MNYQNVLLCIIIFIIIYKLLFSKENESFYDFHNIPKTYNELITDINKSPEKGIPKIIHHICPNDFKKWHPSWLICYESWIKYYPKSMYYKYCYRIKKKNIGIQSVLITSSVRLLLTNLKLIII